MKMVMFQILVRMTVQNFYHWLKSNYRDYRISVQLAAAIFEDREVYGDGAWNDALIWLGIHRGSYSAPLEGRSFDDGGYHVLKSQTILAVMRYPRFRFRPSQCDLLHVDLWYRGRNLLRDAGTFSYNSDESKWFSGTSAHNTIVVDDRNQMPTYGRFLFGMWPSAKNVQCVKTNGSSVTPLLQAMWITKMFVISVI